MILSRFELEPYCSKREAGMLVKYLEKKGLTTPVIRRQKRGNAHGGQSTYIVTVTGFDLDTALKYLKSLKDRDTRSHVQKSCNDKLNILQCFKIHENPGHSSSI